MSLGMYTDLFEGSIEPFSTAWTLFCVIGCTMAMEARDDINRHSQDAVTNATVAHIIKSEPGSNGVPRGVESMRRWDELRTFDLVLLRVDEKVPADLIVISTSNEDGLCYVETKNIDGETNLKIRTSCSKLLEISRKGLNVDDLSAAEVAPGDGGGDKEEDDGGLDAYAAKLGAVADNCAAMW